MTKNDIFRRLRFIFDLNDPTLLEIFESAGEPINKLTMHHWLRKDDHELYEKIPDVVLAQFLNGLINHLRGKREGKQPSPEDRLDNNAILRKLRIALAYRDDDMIDVIKLGGFSLSKHELSAFFRKPEHRHYRQCQNQVLRYFLNGLQLKLRNVKAAKSDYE